MTLFTAEGLPRAHNRHREKGICIEQVATDLFAHFGADDPPPPDADWEKYPGR